MLESLGDRVRTWSSASQEASPWTPLAAVGVAVWAYPQAKEGMISRGYTAAEVEAMPVAKVVLLDSVLTYNEFRDEMFKWFAVPWPQAQAGLAAAGRHLRTAEHQGAIPLAVGFLPAIEPAYCAHVRHERTIAALRVVEAIRLYAASHGQPAAGQARRYHRGPHPAGPDHGKAVPLPADRSRRRPRRARIARRHAHGNALRNHLRPERRIAVIVALSRRAGCAGRRGSVLGTQYSVLHPLVGLRSACPTLLVLLAVAASQATAQDKFDPAARAKAVAPFIDDQTVAVLHIDLARMPIDAIFANVLKIVPDLMPAAAQKEIDLAVEHAKPLAGTEIYLIVSIADVGPMRSESNPLLALVSLKPGANEDAIAKVFDFPQGVKKRVGDFS